MTNWTVEKVLEWVKEKHPIYPKEARDIIDCLLAEINKWKLTALGVKCKLDQWEQAERESDFYYDRADGTETEIQWARVPDGEYKRPTINRNTRQDVSGELPRVPYKEQED